MAQGARLCWSTSTILARFGVGFQRRVFESHSQDSRAFSIPSISGCVAVYFVENLGRPKAQNTIGPLGKARGLRPQGLVFESSPFFDFSLLSFLLSFLLASIYKFPFQFPLIPLLSFL